MAQTTSQFANDLVDLLVAQGVALSDAAALKTLIADELTDWMGGAEAFPADTAYRVIQYLGQHTAEMLERVDFWQGTATGGPLSDGNYPLTLADGTVVPVPCLAKILSLTEKGDAGGLAFTFDTTTTDADPGAGKVRFNNASPASVTQIFFDNTEVGAVDVTAWLDSLDDNPAAVRGTLYALDPSGKVMVFHVTGAVTAASGYRKVAVTFVAGSGLFANGARVAFSFAGSGPPGVTPSLSFAFATSTADGDPGAGTFRLNNATLASVTKAFIDNTESGGTDVSAWLDSFDDGGPSLGGHLLIKGVTHPAHFALYKVTGVVVDGTGYRKVDLAHMASAGAWTAADVFTLSLSPSGDRGPTGATGVPFLFSTTTTDSDPGAGKLRLNNATVASVTELYFDNASSLGAAISAWIDTFDDSPASIKGQLTLVETATGNLALFNVTGLVVDGTGYRKVPVAYVASAGTFTDLNQVGVVFAPAGPTGATGPISAVAYTFSTTTTDADPGNGTLRLNNATLASVTQIFADNQDDAANVVSAWLDAFDDSTSSPKGQITLKQVGAPGRFAVFNVTGTVVDGTGYRKIPVTLVSAGSAFQNGAEVTLAFAATGNLGVAANVGRNTFPIPAPSMRPRTSNGAIAGTIETTTNKVMLDYLAFNKDAVNYAQFSVPMPKGWDEGTFTFVVEWLHASSDSNFGTSWSMRARAFSDGDALDAAWGTAVQVNDVGGTALTKYSSVESAAVTIAGSPASEDLVIFEVARVATDGTNDTLGQDGLLLAVRLNFTWAASNDA